MSVTATYPVMAELKEPAHAGVWPPSYASAAHQPLARFGSGIDQDLHGQPGASPHTARARSVHQPADSQAYSYGRYPQDDSDPYDRHQQTALSSHHSYPNLKRPFSQTEQPPYQEIVQDLRDDGSKLTVSHDHKLLSFKRSLDKQTVVDAHGRVRQLELSAQLHGMFFLSEMPSNTPDGAVGQPELTCYRRNLFQISGSLITPRGQLSVVTETGETVPVTSTEVTVSSIESVDGHPVRLIVIPWKTPPPNSPEVSQTADQEPPALPLIPLQDESAESDGEYAVYPVGWRRLQFRIATANNGRRKELQQHFVLHLKVMGTLANGTRTVLSEATTSPIVVRGRSPRNFQARKEIPLLGSSAGSRGQALVETGLGIVAGPLAPKSHDTKPRPLDMQMPRSAFTFSSGGPKMPGEQIGTMRSNSYSSWSSPTVSHGGYPATTMAADPYQKAPLSAASFTAEPQEMPLQSSVGGVPMSMGGAQQGQPPHQQPVASRGPYAYGQTTGAQPLSIPTTSDPALHVPRYMDSNPRALKSPRHGSQPSVHSTGSMSHNESTSEYRYGSSYVPLQHGGGDMPPSSYGGESAAASQNPSARGYYPPSGSWTTSAGEPTSTAAYASSEGRAYPSPDQFKGSGSAPGSVKADQVAPPPGSSAHAMYNGPPKETINAMDHYSWHAI